ncbi:MAG: hypothetical protein HYV28_11260 [Ignavibacteriales bacterium]|nr:hypothetical protein [Ignavibacteriales bacterium]
MKLTFLSKQKSVRSILMAFLFLFLCVPTSFAQLSEGGTPYSFSNQVGMTVAEVRMPTVDVERLLAEDKLDEVKGVAMRFGFGHEVNYSMSNSGTWELLPDGARLWRLHILCPEAITTNLVFSEYLLPDGAKLFIYNDSKKEVIGAFTARNNKEDGKFGTTLVRGESCTLEYYLPANAAFEGVVNISKIVHGYKEILRSRLPGEDYGGSGACNNNVNCPVGADWQNEKRSNALIINDGTRWCSGSMINNVRMDLTPYFLTANHCISGETPSTWVFVFKYESPTCVNQDGPLNYALSGSTLKANNAASDFALLKLNEARYSSSGWRYQENFFC